MDPGLFSELTWIRASPDSKNNRPKQTVMAFDPPYSDISAEELKSSKRRGGRVTRPWPVQRRTVLDLHGWRALSR